MKVKELVGKEVVNSDIVVLGKVIDVDFNEDTFEIENLVIQEGNFQEIMSIKKTEDLIPVENVLTIGDKILLKDI